MLIHTPYDFLFSVLSFKYLCPVSKISLIASNCETGLQNQWCFLILSEWHNLQHGTLLLFEWGLRRWKTKLTTVLCAMVSSKLLYTPFNATYEWRQMIWILDSYFYFKMKQCMADATIQKKASLMLWVLKIIIVEVLTPFPTWWQVSGFDSLVSPVNAFSSKHCAGWRIDHSEGAHTLWTRFQPMSDCRPQPPQLVPSNIHLQADITVVS